MGPLLYKPAPRWQVLAAFGGALAIHGIAVAVAFHKEPPPVDTSNIPTATIEATLDQPPADEPTPPPEDIPVPETPPPPDIQPEFREEQTPPPKTTKITRQPIKAPQVAGPPRPPGTMTASGAKAVAVSAPRPEYPYEARSRHITGSGVALLTVDVASGSVIEATMAQSIGNGILDNAALSAFKRWRFKPGACAPRVKIPITFTMTGASY
ncbi:MAG: energy transducer TonB [Verrucomicrobia bacterium]|nr:energy transducer TonB [Verrucomicrobiota bacterium]